MHWKLMGLNKFALMLKTILSDNNTLINNTVSNLGILIFLLQYIFILTNIIKRNQNTF